MKTTILAILLLLLAAPVAYSATQRRITVLDAYIMPAKSTGACWDACMGRNTAKLKKLLGRLAKATGPKGWAIVAASNVGKWVANGSQAPDPFVTVDFDKGRMIRTNTAKNTLRPSWGSSKILPLGLRESVTIRVWDRDTRFNDPIGHLTVDVPKKYLRHGGIWKLHFPGVYELSLKFSSATPAATSLASGRYRVTVANGLVADTKTNGKAWDALGGRPDPFVTLQIGRQTLRTSIIPNTLRPGWDRSQTVTLSSNDPVQISIWDKDAMRNDLIGFCRFGLVRNLKVRDAVWRLRCGQLRSLIIRFDPAQ
ncbi:MAG: hypothetical protein KAI47_16925 [Deltaproteobacteria bacterium]|nr:hypothetical protein [Deltaproteobacteria bacterium]